MGRMDGSFELQDCRVGRRAIYFAGGFGHIDVENHHETIVHALLDTNK